MLQRLFGPKSKEQGLLIKWVFATSIGFVLGEVFLSRLAFRFVPFSLPQSGFDLFGIMLNIASGIATGISLSVLQWLILRNCIPHSWWWIIATPLGMASGSLVEGFLIAMERRYLAMVISTGVWAIAAWAGVFVYGIMIGLIQWVVVRQSFLKAWTWIIVNGFGWALAITIHDMLRPSFYPCCVDYVLSPVSESIIHGITGIIIGIVTGILLWWLLKQNSLKAQNAA